MAEYGLLWRVVITGNPDTRSSALTLSGPITGLQKEDEEQVWRLESEFPQWWKHTALPAPCNTVSSNTKALSWWGTARTPHSAQGPLFWGRSIEASSHVQMWELDHKESRAPKNWCFWIVVLEKTLESPLDCKEIQPVNRKGNQSWMFIGRTDAKAETPILWPPDAKNWLTGEDPGAGKDWRQEKKETTEDEMVGWHHWLDGHEFEQAPGVGDGQGGLACCSSRGCKESDMTEPLNWTELNWLLPYYSDLKHWFYFIF